uniref:Tubulin-specific chaperone A n=1 Tax=Leersia perrieri TaxID=77586 RepID=A0A0D9X3I6_9ORYZ
MATLRSLKIKASTCRRLVRELRSYEEEVEKEAAKTAGMGGSTVILSVLADTDDFRQTENVLAESRMVVPDCHNRHETALSDLKATLAELEESNEHGVEIGEAESTVTEVEAVFIPRED